MHSRSSNPEGPPRIQSGADHPDPPRATQPPGSRSATWAIPTLMGGRRGPPDTKQATRQHQYCAPVQYPRARAISKTDSRVRAAPKARRIRVPLEVLDHLPHLHGAEFKVLLVLSRRQARDGGRDQKPFPYWHHPAFPCSILRARFESDPVPITPIRRGRRSRRMADPQHGRSQL